MMKPLQDYFTEERTKLKTGWSSAASTMTVAEWMELRSIKDVDGDRVDLGPLGEVLDDKDVFAHPSLFPISVYLDTLCPTIPNGELDGRCVAGLCRKLVLDPCANKNCSALAGHCMKDPVCDPVTGQCMVEPRREGDLRCSDNNTNTFNDMCIEGVCIGSPIDTPQYFKVAEGFCADSEGNML